MTGEIWKLIINYKHPLIDMKQLWRSKEVRTFFMHVKNAWLDTLTFYAPLWPGHEIKIGLFLLKCKQLTVRVVVSSSEFIAVFCNKCNYDHDRSLNSEQQDTGPMTDTTDTIKHTGSYQCVKKVSIYILFVCLFVCFKGRIAPLLDELNPYNHDRSLNSEQ